MNPAEHAEFVALKTEIDHIRGELKHETGVRMELQNKIFEINHQADTLTALEQEIRTFVAVYRNAKDLGIEQWADTLATLRTSQKGEIK